MSVISKSAADVLRKARKLINNPERWTQMASARDIAGYPVGAMDADAVCWCSMGAIIAVGGFDYKIEAAAEMYMNKAIEEIFGRHRFYANWQDEVGRKHDEVLRVFDRAIELAEREENLS